MLKPWSFSQSCNGGIAFCRKKNTHYREKKLFDKSAVQILNDYEFVVAKKWQSHSIRAASPQSFYRS
ncbi:hypothetical protein PHSC3_000060 [Chlamydiales bacterium STE3]|nr:hypothetical protein PHSC3_000060 [Chlamydiales bacterium STE3]